MRNYYFYYRTILIKFIFKLVPINFFLSIIDILSIKESENLFIDAVQVSNSLKWDNQKIRFNVWDKYLSQNLCSLNILAFLFDSRVLLKYIQLMKLFYSFC